MKYTFFILILTMLTINVQGEQWARDGATWHYTWSNYNGAGFIRIEYTGDTLIQGKNCQQLENTRYTFGVTQYDELYLFGKHTHNRFIHSRNDTVFMYKADDDTFTILYHFGAAPGDTWNLGKDTNSLKCGKSITHVTDTGTTEINGELQRFIKVKPDSNASLGLKGIITEHYGPIDNYMFPTERDCDPMVAGHLDAFSFTCYEDATTPLYNPDNTPCERLLDSVKSSIRPDDASALNNRLKLYPNPAVNQVTIELPFTHQQLNQITLFDKQGRIVKSTDNHVIDLSEIKTGVYIVHVELKDGQQLFEYLVRE